MCIFKKKEKKVYSKYWQEVFNLFDEVEAYWKKRKQDELKMMADYQKYYQDWIKKEAKILEEFHKSLY